MCGRFALNEKAEKIADFTAAVNDFARWVPSYSISPTEVVPIVREHVDKAGEVGRSVEAAVWNFWPQFVSKAKRPQFNARLETVATLGLWKKAFASSRCLVPMRGYYEWTERDGLKWPHFLRGGPDLLMAAGIFTHRYDEDATSVQSAAIITREARDASGEIHDRMPAFLTEDVWARWLNPDPLEDAKEKDDMLAMLKAVSDDVAGTIQTYEVDRKVNNSRTAGKDDASLIEPV